MTALSFRPHSPERSWLLGVRVAMTSTVMVGLALAVDGAHAGLGWTLAVTSAVAAAIAATPWGRAKALAPRGWVLQYVWTAMGLVWIGALAVLLDLGPLPVVGMLALAVAASAGSYPRAGAIALGAFAVVITAVTWMLAPGDAPVVHVLIAGAAVAVLFGGGVVATTSLTRTLTAAATEREHAETRNRLLTVAARTVTLDVDRVARRVVDAVVELGFEMAALSVIDGDERRFVATRGFGPGDLRSASVGDGLAGRALREGQLVWVADYVVADERVHTRKPIGTTVAIPLGIGARSRGALVAARSRAGEPSPDDLAVLEVLAQHAGHALANAYRYREEQLVVDRLRELDRMKRDLVSNVSHDLRTPLTSVRGLAGTLRTRADALDPDTSARLVDGLLDNATRLAEMIDGLLDFGASPSADDDTVAVAPVVRACVYRLQAVLQDHDVQVEVPDGLTAAAPGRLLDHVLENLLGNAAKYTPPGTPVHVSARPDGDDVVITVADGGPGIPPDEVPLVTRRFWRGSAAADRPGTGLGLALVDATLRERGSLLEISSTPGAGSAFSFRLPLVAEGRP